VMSRLGSPGAPGCTIGAWARTCAAVAKSAAVPIPIDAVPAAMNDARRDTLSVLESFIVAAPARGGFRLLCAEAAGDKPSRRSRRRHDYPTDGTLPEASSRPQACNLSQGEPSRIPT